MRFLHRSSHSTLAINALPLRSVLTLYELRVWRALNVRTVRQPQRSEVGQNRWERQKG